MKPKDLMVMTADCVLYEVGWDELPAGGLRGEVVIFLERTAYYPVVKVLHPVHGICEIFGHNLEVLDEAR